MLGSVLRDLLSTPPSLASISSRTSLSRYLSKKEPVTIVPSAVSLAHLHCVILFHAHVLRLMHGEGWVRFSAAAKETNFTRRDRRMRSLLMRRPTTSAPRPKCSPNLAPVSKFGSPATSVGLTT